MALSAQVTSWLYNVLEAQYIHKQIVYSHLYQFLEVHLKKNLRFRIRTQIYTSADGKSSLLINLHGKIVLEDVQVPIEIWIPLNYPYRGADPGVPLVYVVPKHEESLYLRPGNHVDTQGRFYHPYLASWHNDCSPENPESVRFNLLELINIVYDTIKREVPIQLTPGAPIQPDQRTGEMAPAIPPKPPKPPKNTQNPNPVALRYQGPLPLPGEQSPVHQNSGSPNIQRPYQSPSQVHPSNYGQFPSQSSLHGHQQYRPSQSQFDEERRNFEQIQGPLGPQAVPYQPQNHQAFSPQHSYQHSHQGPAPQAAPQSAPVRSPEQVQTPRTEKKTPANIDLIDSPIGLVNKSGSRALEKELVKAVDEFVAHDSSPWSVGIEADHNQKKIGALQDQLNHHYTQAVANSEHLDGHIQYLQEKLQSITKLNQDLAALDKINSSQVDCVTTHEATIALDDLIIADSVLVKQLYEVISESKAIKDTISLVSGTFHSQPELINDDRLDMCVKTVRNLGRELFWLELTKNEIAGIMGLHE